MSRVLVAAAVAIASLAVSGQAGAARYAVGWRGARVRKWPCRRAPHRISPRAARSDPGARRRPAVTECAVGDPRDPLRRASGDQAAGDDAVGPARLQAVVPDAEPVLRAVDHASRARTHPCRRDRLGRRRRAPRAPGQDHRLEELRRRLARHGHAQARDVRGRADHGVSGTESSRGSPPRRSSWSPRSLRSRVRFRWRQRPVRSAGPSRAAHASST
jgi:hypothetical protein